MGFRTEGIGFRALTFVGPPTWLYTAREVRGFKNGLKGTTPRSMYPCSTYDGLEVRTM